MDILKKIKEIDIAARCNNRVFYENIMCMAHQQYSESDDCSIYKFIKRCQNDCKGYISDYFSVDNTMAYYPFRLRVLAKYDLISEEEYISDVEMLIDENTDIGENDLFNSEKSPMDICFELWERKINGNAGHDKSSESDT